VPPGPGHPGIQHVPTVQVVAQQVPPAEQMLLLHSALTLHPPPFAVLMQVAEPLQFPAARQVTGEVPLRW
jgi:hypothetical protein